MKLLFLFLSILIIDIFSETNIYQQTSIFVDNFQINFDDLPTDDKYYYDFIFYDISVINNASNLYILNIVNSDIDHHILCHYQCIWENSNNFNLLEKKKVPVNPRDKINIISEGKSYMNYTVIIGYSNKMDKQINDTSIIFLFYVMIPCLMVILIFCCCKIYCMNRMFLRKVKKYN